MKLFIIGIDNRTLSQRFFSAISSKCQNGEFEGKITAMELNEGNYKAKNKKITAMDISGYNKAYAVPADDARAAVMDLWFSREINVGQRETLLKEAEKIDRTTSISAPKTEPAP